MRDSILCSGDDERAATKRQYLGHQLAEGIFIPPHLFIKAGVQNDKEPQQQSDFIKKPIQLKDI